MYRCSQLTNQMSSKQKQCSFSIHDIKCTKKEKKKLFRLEVHCLSSACLSESKLPHISGLELARSLQQSTSNCTDLPIYLRQAVALQKQTSLLVWMHNFNALDKYYTITNIMQMQLICNLPEKLRFSDVYENNSEMRGKKI